MLLCFMFFSLFLSTTVEWSALHLPQAGINTYGRISVDNSSHLNWELCDGQTGNVLDSFSLHQSHHGNFSLATLPHNVSHMINQNIIAQGGKPGTYDFVPGNSAELSKGSSEGWSKYSLEIGLGILAVVLVCVVGVIALRSFARRRRVSGSRRWQEIDREPGSFHSVASDDDSDDNDFEINMLDSANKQRSKLLTSY